MTKTSAGPTSVARRRLIGLDGLRGMLSLCVILVHVTAHFSPTILGKTHVDVLGQAIVIFFVMSGFLIYYPFARALLDSRNPLERSSAYARSRFMRVFPAYIVIFLLANLSGTLFLENAMVLQQQGGAGSTGSITQPATLFLHLTLLQNYIPSQLQTGLSSSWTLTAEVAFYVLLPFLAALFFWLIKHSRWLRAKNRYAVVAIPGVLLIINGIVWRVVTELVTQANGLDREMSEWGPNWVAVLSRSILPWSDNFGWGMILAAGYLALQRGDLLTDQIMRLRQLSWWFIAAGLAASSLLYLTAPRFIGATFAIFSTGLLALMILPADGKSSTWRFAELIDNRVLHWLGTTSLSTYLLHFPVLLLLERFGLTMGDSWSGWLYNFALVTVVSVALASLSYTFIEKPALQWATKQKKQKG